LLLLLAVPGLVQRHGKKLKNIEDIQVGDYVQAYDFETGEITHRRVLAVSRGFTYHLVDITVSDDKISATRLHQFWVESEQSWIDAADLEPGMQVRLADGRLREIRAVSIRALGHPEPTFNLEVEGVHNYFVGQGHVLVHNGTPFDAPGYWNYYLVDKKGKIYYVGRGGPDNTEKKIRNRHEVRSRPGYPAAYASPGRFVPANGDRMVRVPGTRTYGEMRIMEHVDIIRHETYVGRGDNHRGNRDPGISPRRAARFYPKGGYPVCP